MKTIKEIEKQLEILVEKNVKSIQESEDKIEQANQKIAQANIDLINSENEANPEKYAKVKETLWTAKHTKELYIKQKDKLENMLLVNKVEYNQFLLNITKATDAVHKEQNERARELISELKHIADESLKTTQQSNKLMHTLQYDAYKDADKLVGATGNIVTQPKEYANYKTVHNFYQQQIKNLELIN